jgi:transglutaminase-like putative cysteine protease
LVSSSPIQADVLLFPDQTFQYQRPIIADLSLTYQLENERFNGLQPSQASLKLERQFPSELNPRASKLISQLVDPNKPWTTVNGVLAWYRSQPFSYTLEPKRISGPDFVDQFLFDTQSGFCEHYAYSFVALMRLAGIPARIVGGYMGGELNPLNNTIVVRELDAHAWAEVWIEGRGWVRVDPTGVVAPERVERGSIDSLEGTSGYLLNSPLTLLRFRNSVWINNLRLRLDAMSYEWQTSIMNYRYEQQATVLKGLLGEVTSNRILLLLGLAALVTVSPAVLWITWRRLGSYRDPMHRRLWWFDRELRRRGVIRQSGDTIRQACTQISFKDTEERSRFENDVYDFERRYYANKTH